jgi:bifunctional DNase/RNase
VTINNPPQTAVPLETPVVIDSLRISKIEGRKVVVFVDDTTQRYLPIWVGPNEADAILYELQNIPHHTSSALIEQLNPQGKPVKITISELVDDVYKATITLEKDGQETIMAMRPSDAILVAIRLKLPMMVSNTVMQLAAKSIDLRRPIFVVLLTTFSILIPALLGIGGILTQSSLGINAFFYLSLISITLSYQMRHTTESLSRIIRFPTKTIALLMTIVVAGWFGLNVLAFNRIAARITIVAGISLIEFTLIFNATNYLSLLLIFLVKRIRHNTKSK